MESFGEHVEGLSNFRDESYVVEPKVQTDHFEQTTSRTRISAIKITSVTPCFQRVQATQLDKSAKVKPSDRTVCQMGRLYILSSFTAGKIGSFASPLALRREEKEAGVRCRGL
ncbi:MAG: hypothetical protein C0483_11230 [Pirellula sp.]|nr:hypothetical protein [Pirellula sp.]